MDLKPCKTMKRERIGRGWTQAELARRTGINRVDITLLELGGRQAFPGWRRRIAKAFRMKETDLFPEVLGDGENEA